MQVWDQRQSNISLTGSLLFVGIVAAVLINREWPLLWLAPAALIAALLYVGNMQRYLFRRNWSKQPFPPRWRLFLVSKVEYYRRLSESERTRFENNVKWFLKENRISGVGAEVEDETRLLVATSAVMLIFGHNDWEYPKLPEILIYPGTFDENYNFDLSTPSRVIAGQVVHNNAIILSQDQLWMGFEQPGNAYHVGLHEFAHALDLSDGTADGIPGDLDARLIRQWYELIKDELDKVRERRSVLNPYAGKNSAELFAVAVEHFFQRPRELHSLHPELYDALSSFFNQTPG